MYLALFKPQLNVASLINVNFGCALFLFLFGRKLYYNMNFVSIVYCELVKYNMVFIIDQ